MGFKGDRFDKVFKGMREINSVRQYILRNYRELLICLMAGAIPFPIAIGNAALIVACAVSLFAGLKARKEINLKSFAFLFPSVFFGLIVISVLASKNWTMGFPQLDKGLLYVIIVIALFGLKPIDSLILKKGLTVFALVSLLMTIILIFRGLLLMLAGNSVEVLFFHEFSEILDQHAVYFALYLSFSVFTLSHYYLHSNTAELTRRIWLVIGAICILIVGILFTASKAVIIGFFILYVIQVVFLLKNRRLKTALLILVVGFGVLITLVPMVQSRFTKGLEFNIEVFQPTNELMDAKVFSNEEKSEISDLELRYIFWKIGTYHLIKDQKYLFGYGLGDVQDLMDYYFLTYGLAPGWFEGYNLHNQYLQIFVAQGIFVLLFFLGYLGYSFNRSFTRHNTLHLLFLLLIVFVFFFECLLYRNKGIVFFIFMNTLFLINTNTYETGYSRDTRNS